MGRPILTTLMMDEKSRMSLDCKVSLEPLSKEEIKDFIREGCIR